MQRNQLHPVHQRLGIAEPVPLAALMYGAAMACALWKNGAHLSALWRRDHGDSQKSLSAFETKTSALGKTRFPILSGEASDVIGVEGCVTKTRSTCSGA